MSTPLPHNARAVLDPEYFSPKTGIDQVIDAIEWELWEMRRRLAKMAAKGRLTGDPGELSRATGASRAYCRQRIINATTTEPTRQKRRKVLERDGYKCRMCGSTRNVEVDHIIPRSAGGGNELSNLQALCHRHNVLKGSTVPASFGGAVL